LLETGFEATQDLHVGGEVGMGRTIGLLMASLTMALVASADLSSLGFKPVIAQPLLSEANAEPTYTLLGVSFSSPERFSSPIAAPQQGVSLLYPATSTPGNEDFKVTLRSLPPKDAILDALSEAELQQWARYTQLGLQRQPDGKIERTILGRRLIGDLQIDRSRRQMVSEIYILSLSTGHRLLLTFETNQRLSLQKAEDLIGTIATSMEELPNNSKAWKDSFRWQKRKAN
jgi:hypothetical protein